MTFRVTKLEVMEAGVGGAVLGGFASVPQLLDPNYPLLLWFVVQALCFVGFAVAFVCATAIVDSILRALRHLMQITETNEAESSPENRQRFVS